MLKAKYLVGFLVGFVLMGAAASAPASAGVFTGALSGSSWLGEIGECDFLIASHGTGAPPAAQTLYGSTLDGYPDGSGTPCEPAILTVSDIEAGFANHGAHDDMILYPTFTFASSWACEYSVTAAMILHGGSTPNGPWSGSAGASGSFLCGSATFNLTDVTYHP